MATDKSQWHRAGTGHYERMYGDGWTGAVSRWGRDQWQVALVHKDHVPRTVDGLYLGGGVHRTLEKAKDVVDNGHACIVKEQTNGNER